MYESPRKEILRLLEIFKKREPKAHIVERFRAFVSIASLILLLPRVKKAFRDALSKIEFSRLQLDAADRYWVLTIQNYEFMGIPIEERAKIYTAMHPNGLPPAFDVTGGTATPVMQPGRIDPFTNKVLTQEDIEQMTQRGV